MYIFWVLWLVKPNLGLILMVRILFWLDQRPKGFPDCPVSRSVSTRSGWWSTWIEAGVLLNRLSISKRPPWEKWETWCYGATAWVDPPKPVASTWHAANTAQALMPLWLFPAVPGKGSTDCPVALVVHLLILGTYQASSPRHNVSCVIAWIWMSCITGVGLRYGYVGIHERHSIISDAMVNQAIEIREVSSFQELLFLTMSHSHFSMLMLTHRTHVDRETAICIWWFSIFVNNEPPSDECSNPNLVKSWWLEIQHGRVILIVQHKLHPKVTLIVYNDP